MSVETDYYIPQMKIKDEQISLQASEISRLRAMSKKVFETEIDATELTLRIAESCLGMKRPPGMSAKDALAELRASAPEHIAGFDRAAMRAAEYFVECINKSGHFAEMN